MKDNDDFKRKLRLKIITLQQRNKSIVKILMEAKEFYDYTFFFVISNPLEALFYSIYFVK